MNFSKFMFNPSYMRMQNQSSLISRMFGSTSKKSSASFGSSSGAKRNSYKPPQGTNKQYQAALKMMGVSSVDPKDWRMQRTLQNYMKSFDADGDYIDPVTGISGMLATGIPVSERHQIIDVSESARQAMFDETKRHFIEENGNLNGRTTKRSDVFQAYQRSVPKSDRLKGTWTLEQYERQYRSALTEAVKAADPLWDYGKPFDKKVLDSVTREDVESRLVSDGVNLSKKKVDFYA